jgi:hypothetical protein
MLEFSCEERANGLYSARLATAVQDDLRGDFRSSHRIRFDIGQARAGARPRLLLFFAAVGEEFAARDEAALVGGEKQDGVGDLVGAGDSSQRQSAT